MQVPQIPPTLDSTVTYFLLARARGGNVCVRRVLTGSGRQRDEDQRLLAARMESGARTSRPLPARTVGTPWDSTRGAVPGGLAMRHAAMEGATAARIGTARGLESGLASWRGDGDVGDGSREWGGENINLQGAREQGGMRMGRDAGGRRARHERKRAEYVGSVRERASQYARHSVGGYGLSFRRRRCVRGMKSISGGGDAKEKGPHENAPYKYPVPRVRRFVHVVLLAACPCVRGVEDVGSVVDAFAG
ncbi:hypothetical protein B0H16DRAFT_1779047 [Mycena metata]|uniref:Uncharacterized protein n=1 Tax=Mycena metata TaxID=1033252 RepID=A0AAD7JSA0_9AGAR|nr:hypothetical protein B0H16DRAFT_1779047 [Mycena metata]